MEVLWKFMTSEPLWLILYRLMLTQEKSVCLGKKDGTQLLVEEICHWWICQAFALGHADVKSSPKVKTKLSLSNDPNEFNI